MFRRCVVRVRIPIRYRSNMSRRDATGLERIRQMATWLRRRPAVSICGTIRSWCPQEVPLPSIEVILRNDNATIEGMVEGASALTGPAAPISLGPYGIGGPSGQDSSARLYFIPLPDSEGRFTEQLVSKDGKFSVSLPPGEYRVLAFPQVRPELEYENQDAMRAYDGKGQVVRLAAGQKAKMQLQLVTTSE